VRTLAMGIALAGTLAAAVAARAASELLWVDTVDRAGGVDIAQAAAADGARFFAAGQSAGAGGDPDVLVRAYETRTGALLWQDVYNPAAGFDAARDVAAGGGRVFVAGTSRTPTGRNFLVRAYDAATGALLWQDEHPGAGGLVPGSGGVANTVSVDGDRLFAGGTLSRAPGNFDFFVRSYDAETGAVLWEDKVDEGPAGRVGQVTAHGGRAYAVGFVGSCNEFFDNGGDCDFVLRAYDGISGRLLWRQRADLGRYDIGRAVAAAGNVIVGVGYGGEFATSDFTVRAYDAVTGTLAWADRADKAGQVDKAFSVAAGAGRVFAVGTGGTCNLFVAPGGDCDGLVRAYDAMTGTLVWEDVVDGGGDAYFGADVGVLTGAIDVSSSLLFASGAGGDCRWDVASNCDLLVRAYRMHDGDLAWEQQFDRSGGDDAANDLALHGDSLFAVGGSSRAFAADFDFLVLAYDARGSAR
jgi:PQQ-like domain